MRDKTVTSSVTSQTRAVTAGQRIAELRVGQSIVLDKIPMGGSLEARRLPAGGVQFYWRYTQGGKTNRVPIGLYDSASPPKALTPSVRGFSVAAAIEAARELAKENSQTPGGLQAKRARDEEARVKAENASRLREKHTLRALCDVYVNWLTLQKKSSAYDAQNVFQNHLSAPFPELSAKAAAEVEKREVVIMLRRLTESGKTTTARKLRSYLRAAYACAMRADSDATLPSAFISFAVELNPVEATAAIRGRSDKNPLTAEQLKKYWRALKQCDGVIGAALRLHVISGGQRVAQLVRLRDDDVSAFSVRLLDSKGRRAEPRVHLLPKTDAIARELRLLPNAGYLLSTDSGATPMHPTSLSSWAAAIAVQAGLRGFQLKRVRSGVETTLAEAGVSLHVRGLLQSHGVGGVQEKHYDAHEYMSEKRSALDLLLRILEGKNAPQPRRSKHAVELVR
jgi:hypothetical protein